MRSNQLDCNRPLPQSLSHLARLAMRRTNAAGFAIDKLMPDGQAWVRLCAEGLAVPEVDCGDLRVVCFPLGTEDAETGALSFVFRGGTSADPAHGLLNRVAGDAQDIWQLWQAPRAYAGSMIRIAELSAELADAKIADRVCALLESKVWEVDPIEAISRSVHIVLHPYQLGPVLDGLVRDLERDLAEYEIVRKAKAVLQSREGMSEKQAYVHLRDESRQSRRRLSDVAEELLGQRLVPRYRARWRQKQGRV